MGTEQANEEDIFRNAIQFENRNEQADYLRKACGDDIELRKAIEALLQHHYASSILDSPAFGAGLLDEETAVTEAPGATIGRYKLLERIGEGGMAVVYMAEQQKPIHRNVALKIIKLGMDTKSVIARFEAERQALAMMDHPNIAKVFDAGATETGRPYFVMELVRGASITDYCDQANLTTEERLVLFMQVCTAVQHAHQKGIIHRDIKPSNVMVALHDGKPVPKVIDFGIAKATNQRLTEKTLFTRYAQMIGTPAYMSPEQAELSDLDVDTRSDIYSLGVLLYELLTGTTPFSEEDLRRAGYLEMQRIIAEQEPTKPSTKLSTLGETLTEVARRRSSTPDVLRKSLRGDLDWIVMKSLEKQRDRRYGTASELSADIDRHLSNEPVQAAAPNLSYRTRKFVRRHRIGVLVALLISVALLAVLSALSVATVLIWREQGRTQRALEREQKALAQETRARVDAEQARAREEQARTEAQQQTKVAQAVADFLNYDLLASVDPARARGRQVTVREIVDAASQRIEGRFKDQPFVEASVRLTLGNTYTQLGEYAEAARQLEKVRQMHREHFPQDDPRAIESMRSLGWLYVEQARYQDAEPLLVGALETSERVLGHEHLRTLDCMTPLALLYKKQGRYEEARQLFFDALEIEKRTLGAEHLLTLNTMHNLATLYDSQGRYQDAEALYREVLKIKQYRFGEDHPDTLRTMGNIANLCSIQGRYSEAEQLYRKTMEITKRVLGEEHPDTLGSMNNLGGFYCNNGRYQEAEPLLAEAVKTTTRTLGEEHPQTLLSMNSLAILRSKQGRYSDAEPLGLKMLEIRERLLGKDHPDTVKTVSFLSALYKAWGKPEEAQKWQARLSESQAERAVVQAPAYVIPETNLEIPDKLKGCAVNLEKIRTGIDKYKKDKGAWPNWLSDLVGDYLSAESLLCMDDPRQKAEFSPDPKLPCSYCWELSSDRIGGNWDPTGRASNRDWKLQQTKVFGDIVPMVRCMHHGDNRVLNLSIGGKVFWGPLDWEYMFKQDYQFGQERSVQPSQVKAEAPSLSGDSSNQPPLGTSLSERTRLIASGSRASWSPDGSCLVFGEPQQKGLQIFDVESGTTTDLTSPGKDPAWSPDGRFIAFVKGNGSSDETWLVKSTGEAPRKLIDGGYPNWSADGKILYVQSRKENRILSLDVDDPNVQPGVFFDGPQSWYPAVSPDGKRVAFGRPDQLVITDSQTKRIVLIWPVPGCRGLLPAWSADGRQIAFGGFDNEPSGVWVLDVEAKEAVRVAQGPYTMPAWSKDGTKLAFDLRSESTREIWMVRTQEIRGRKFSAAEAAQLGKPLRGPRIAKPGPPVISPAEMPLIPKPAPAFVLQDLNGQQVSLADFKGKVVLLDFWATWCEPCARVITHLETLHSRYKDQGLVVIGLNEESDHAKVRQFAEQHMSYAVLLDANRQFADYGVKTIPTLFHIDKAGNMRYREIGFVPGNESLIEARIKELLRSEPDQKPTGE